LTPGISKNKSGYLDGLLLQKLDQVQIKTNFFLEYHGGDKVDETTIIPIEVEVNFLMALRQGIGSRFGPNQELAFQWLWPFSVQMKQCQKVKSKNLFV
jgi:hypothetical protein